MGYYRLRFTKENPPPRKFINDVHFSIVFHSDQTFLNFGKNLLAGAVFLNIIALLHRMRYLNK
jgi:hypothetical protein